MKYFDISVPLREGVVAWPGDVNFEREEKRGRAIVSKITTSSHTGTHIDAPRHFLFDQYGIDRIALNKLIGRCKVVEVKSPPARGGEPAGGGEGVGGNQISVSDIKRFKLKLGDRILFKTRNSKLVTRKQFTSNYVSLSLEAAQYLAQKKIYLVGIDYFGIEAKSAPGHPVHKALLQAGIVIVEGLDLSKIKPGHYNLAALPLRIANGDGSPCRAVLWK